ncbi:MULTISPECIES: FecR/PupR family sigma factor regulator [unclassified Phenylobacterium]|uniref:FecR/PupR family sigma factor regulator n=1 Tax=unclassified Phenylobacterium TaxID=2640670 RepID=UPI003F50C4C4
MSRKTTKAGPDQKSLAEASAWLARMSSPSATLEDASAVDAWLAEDPRNLVAWRAACALWAELGGAGDDPAVAALRAETARRTARRDGKDD